jgi:hypothetical protein
MRPILIDLAALQAEQEQLLVQQLVAQTGLELVPWKPCVPAMLLHLWIVLLPNGRHQQSLQPTLGFQPEQRDPTLTDTMELVREISDAVADNIALAAEYHMSAKVSSGQHLTNQDMPFAEQVAPAPKQSVLLNATPPMLKKKKRVNDGKVNDEALLQNSYATPTVNDDNDQDIV